MTTQERARELAQKFMLEQEYKEQDETIDALADLLTRFAASERLALALDIRARYHGTDEVERQIVIVRYMDKLVSELERTAKGESQ